MEIGLYYISTNDAFGEITRIKLNTTYNIIGIKIPSNFPGDTQLYIYFYDIMTNQAPHDFRQSMKYSDFIRLNYHQRNISSITYSHYINNNNSDEVVLSNEIRKFISKYCLKYSPTPYFNQTMKEILLFNSNLSPPSIIFVSSTNVVDKSEILTHYIFSSSSLTQTIKTTPPPSQLSSPSSASLSNKDDNVIIIEETAMIKQLQDYVNSWCKSINNNTTPVILINELLTVLHAMSTSTSATNLPIRIDKDENVTALVVISQPNSPFEIKLPMYYI